MDGPRRKDFVLFRGDNWSLIDDTVTFDDARTLQTAGVVMRSTVKRFPATQADPIDADPLVDAATGVMQVDSATRGGLVLDGVDAYTVTYTCELTELLVPGLYHYDVTIDFSSTESYTLWFGEIRVPADVTRTRT